MKKHFLLFVLIISSLLFAQSNFTKQEIALIKEGGEDEMMKVMSTEVEAENIILTTVSDEINPSNKFIKQLSKRMFLAMRDPNNPGIGIAAPQVGINKKLIWVQRFDKENSPFEFYINPTIIWQSDLLQKGPEGCLSIPNFGANIYRSYAIQISYYTLEGEFVKENIEGFTAVVFQHEIDHLNGILITQRAKEQESLEVKPSNSKLNLYYIK